MMTEHDAKAHAQRLVKSERMIEAGFVMLMLSYAPDRVTDKEIASVRGAFFTGAKYLFDILHMPLVGGDRALEDLRNTLEQELRRFSDIQPKHPLH